jgi:hypothetical protein
MQQTVMTYGSFQPVTPSDSTLINCRAICVGGAGNLTISKDATSTGVLFTVIAGQTIPIMLEQGRIMATGTTATLMVALA